MLQSSCPCLKYSSKPLLRDAGAHARGNLARMHKVLCVPMPHPQRHREAPAPRLGCKELCKLAPQLTVPRALYPISECLAKWSEPDGLHCMCQHSPCMLPLQDMLLHKVSLFQCQAGPYDDSRTATDLMTCAHTLSVRTSMTPRTTQHADDSGTHGNFGSRSALPSLARTHRHTHRLGPRSAHPPTQKRSTCLAMHQLADCHLCFGTGRP